MLKARLDVIRAISPYKSPALYRGLVDLPDRGITQVTIELPYGTERFYRVPHSGDYGLYAIYRLHPYC